MKIMVSACLLGENCKYSGGNNRNEKVLSFIDGHEVFSCLSGGHGRIVHAAPAGRDRLRYGNQ